MTKKFFVCLFILLVMFISKFIVVLTVQLAHIVQCVDIGAGYKANTCVYYMNITVLVQSGLLSPL